MMQIIEKMAGYYSRTVLSMTIERDMCLRVCVVRPLSSAKHQLFMQNINAIRTSRARRAIMIKYVFCQNQALGCSEYAGSDTIDSDGLIAVLLDGVWNPE